MQNDPFLSKTRNSYMEHIIMSKKEREQLIVFEKIKRGDITRLEAALQLDVSERWIRKKYKRYLISGANGSIKWWRQN